MDSVGEQCASEDGARRIARVAARLFARDGFRGVSVATLAREASVSKATVFHHYPSKEALYYQVLQAACRETTEVLQEIASEDNDAERALAEFARFHLRHLFDQADVSQLVLRELLDAESERIRTLAEKVYGDNFQRLVQLIRRGQEDGLFAAEHDPALVALTLAGAQLFFFQARHFLAHMPEVDFAERPEAFGEGLLDLLMKGLRPR